MPGHSSASRMSSVRSNSNSQSSSDGTEATSRNTASADSWVRSNPRTVVSRSMVVRDATPTRDEMSTPPLMATLSRQLDLDSRSSSLSVR